MDKTIRKEFVNPGTQYRGAPFWAWNGKLEPEELKRQIRIMHRMGLGGFFMHSRVGLDTVYLSERWFECVQACVDEAEKLDMQAWLYDEDRWPSGAAGGLVTKNPKYRARSLKMQILSTPSQLKWSSDSVAAFTAVLKGASARDVKQLTRGKRPSRLSKNESILHFVVEMERNSDWYNGYTYLDTISHEAVREFIRVTHKAYLKQYGKDFGKRIPGIFTDEPNTGNFGPDRMPWTKKLPAVFKKRYGYDLIPELPRVFFDVDGQKISQPRWHAHDCVTFLFVDAFARQIGEWCGRNKLQFTGHVLEEDTLSSQTVVVGSAMRSYEYMQAPGMDLLTEHWRVYDVAKQVSSMARQFGKKWRLTETYGCTGWDFPFLGHKAEGDWQAALGINLRCQHLSWYTMLGEAKRDYPASIFYQSPWWEVYPKVEDYFARINTINSHGTEVRDVLVIHPIESMWVLFNHKRDETAVKKLNSIFVGIRDSLLGANIDFDYGEEEVMSRHGSVGRSNGKPVLRINKASYKAVVVPPMNTMRSSTLKLLEKFRQAGGTVVFVGKPSGYVDAEPSLRVKELAEICVQAPEKGSGLSKAVSSAGRRIHITDGKGKEIGSTLHIIREDKNNFYLFVCNTGITHTATTEVYYEKPMARDRKQVYPQVVISGFPECKGHPVEMDPESGAMYSADAACVDGQWEIETSFPILGSRLFRIPKKKEKQSMPARKKMKTIRTLKLGGGKWDIALSEATCLVLDRPAYRVNSGKRQGPEEILRLDRAVRTSMGIPVRSGGMVQPWARKKNAKPKRADVELIYEFEAKALPLGDLFLALERPETFKIEVNGQALSMDAECGWWCDLSLRKIPVDPNLIKIGKNKIRMICDFDETHSGFEIVYLLGTFGTGTKGASVFITEPPTSLKVGDWVKQGLAFYAGSVSYRKIINPRVRKGERVLVSVPEYRGAAVRVLVNGKSAGIIGWEPNEIDITDLLNGRPAELRIEVIGHRRNSHGPHHCSEKWPTWTGPGQFVTTGKNWINGYQLVPCGMMKEPRLIVKS